MCRSIVDIQSPTAEIRRGKKERRKKIETGWKYIWSPYYIGRLTLFREIHNDVNLLASLSNFVRSLWSVRNSVSTADDAQCPPWRHDLRRRRHCLTAQSVIFWSNFCHSSSSRDLRWSMSRRHLRFTRCAPDQYAPYMIVYRIQIRAVWRP